MLCWAYDGVKGARPLMARQVASRDSQGFTGFYMDAASTGSRAWEFVFPLVTRLLLARLLLLPDPRPVIHACSLGVEAVALTHDKHLYHEYLLLAPEAGPVCKSFGA